MARPCEQGLPQSAKLLAQALRDRHQAGKTFAFVTAVLDCLDDARAFYRRYDFAQLPGHPHRLFLSARCLEAMMDGS